jgi:hypothetical protein
VRCLAHSAVRSRGGFATGVTSVTHLLTLPRTQCVRPAMARIWSADYAPQQAGLKRHRRDSLCPSTLVQLGDRLLSSMELPQQLVSSASTGLRSSTCQWERQFDPVVEQIIDAIKARIGAYILLQDGAFRVKRKSSSSEVLVSLGPKHDWRSDLLLAPGSPPEEQQTQQRSLFEFLGAVRDVRVGDADPCGVEVEESGLQRNLVTEEIRLLSEAIDFTLEGKQTEELDVLMPQLKSVMLVADDSSGASAEWLEASLPRCTAGVYEASEEDLVRELELGDVVN